jgi:hypothetical protein
MQVLRNRIIGSCCLHYIAGRLEGKLLNPGTNEFRIACFLQKEWRKNA